MIVIQEKLCIFQNGIRYCESTPITPYGLLITGILLLLAVVWAGLMLHPRIHGALLFAIGVSPLVIFAVVLILAGSSL